MDGTGWVGMGRDGLTDLFIEGWRAKWRGTWKVLTIKVEEAIGPRKWKTMVIFSEINSEMLLEYTLWMIHRALRGGAFYRILQFSIEFYRIFYRFWVA